MYMSIGQLCQRVQVERSVSELDGEGNLVEKGRAVYAQTWAKVLPFAAKIADGYAEKVNEVDYRVVVRYRQDIQLMDVLLWRDKRLQLIAPPYDMDGRKKWLVMECRELVEDVETQ